MKRARDDDDEVTIRWKTRDGNETRLTTNIYSKFFLRRYSGFFDGYFRNDEGSSVNINLVYPTDIVKNLFKHLDGESLSLTDRQECMLNQLLDFLILKTPYDKVDNVGFEENIEYCAWCSKVCDKSPCPAKRWIIVNNRQQCALCCEALQFCHCVHQNEHCSDYGWVYKFQRRSSLI